MDLKNIFTLYSDQPNLYLKKKNRNLSNIRLYVTNSGYNMPKQ